MPSIYSAQVVILKLSIWYAVSSFLITFTATNLANHEPRQLQSIKAEEINPKFKPIRYMLGVDSVGRDEAQHRCRSRHAELATINSLDDLKSIKTFLDREPNGNKFWISGFFRYNDKCHKHPFNAQCWFWDTTKGEISYNPELIQFIESSQTRKPSISSTMILLKRNRLKLDFDDRNSIHVYICDRAPSIFIPDNCTCTN